LKSLEPRRLLMIAEKFPPFNQSGSARPFYFAKYLPEFAYAPQVLASSLLPGEERDDALLSELPGSVQVQRTPRLISPRVAQLSQLWRTRHPARGAAEPGAQAEQGAPLPRGWVQETYGWLGWWSHWELDWALLATLAGARHAWHRPPQLIWASGPHFRNFVVAMRLSTWLRVPLVVDLRDPWTYGSLWRPRSRRSAQAERAWAERVLGHAARIVFTSPLTLEAMNRRFPELPRERLLTITNGFEEGSVEPLRQLGSDRCLFRYIGVLNERRLPDVLIRAFAAAAVDPEFRAKARLEFIGKAGGHEGKTQLAPGCDVSFRGHVSRADSLRLMAGSDVNLLLQTISEGEDVISGKAFDYLRVRKPIIGIVDPAGGDAWLLRETGAGPVAPWQDVGAIERELAAAFRRWRNGEPLPLRQDVSRYSRRGLAAQLAAVFDELLTDPATNPGSSA
jgi:glycosyltransferase involved in cell wall biosynthesis